MPLRKHTRSALFCLEAEDHAAFFGIEAAQTAVFSDGDLRIRISLGDQRAQLLCGRCIEAMVESDGTATAKNDRFQRIIAAPREFRGAVGF